MEEKSIHFDEINLHGLVLLLLKNLWVIAAFCISAILCYTSVCKLTYSPSYTSSATFMVSAKDATSAYNSLTTTQSMASVFVEVFQSNVLREKIQEQMPDQRLGISPAVKNYAGFDLPCGKNGLAKCFYGKKICSR